MKEPELWEGLEEEIVESDHGIVGLRLDPTGHPIPLFSEERIHLPRHGTAAWCSTPFPHLGQSSFPPSSLSVYLLNTASPNTANLSPKFIVPEPSD